MRKLARIHLGNNYPTLSSKIGKFLEGYCTPNAPKLKVNNPRGTILDHFSTIHKSDDLQIFDL